MHVTRKLNLLLITTGVSLSINACGAGNDPTSLDVVDATDHLLFVSDVGNSENNQQLVSTYGVETAEINFDGDDALSGTWVQCAVKRQNKYVFEGRKFQYHHVEYQYDNCQGNVISDYPPPNVPLFSGTYVLSGVTNTASGLTARNIDFTTDFYFSEVEGIDNLLTIYEDDAKLFSYNIVYTGTIDELVFGRGDGSVPDLRPIALNFDIPFVRQ